LKLISLQKGHGSEQASGLPGLLDMGCELSDFADTAALLRSLDLVVTVDSAVAHLAGALGVETWVALPFVLDWRWLTERADSPWYPTLRLFRQKQPGQWDDVFARIAAALGERGASETE
jgi:ADP-heptose:LPS heptosyltransferase